MSGKSYLVSASAEARVGFAKQWLVGRGRATEVVIVGATMQAAADLTRSAGEEVGSSFGWHRMTLVRLAWSLADVPLAKARRVPASSLALEAVAARVVHQAVATGELGRFLPIADRPGLPRALARTFSELRHARVHPTDLGDADLARLFDACNRDLDATRLVDLAELFETATRVLRDNPARLPHPVLFLDVPLERVCEVEFVRAVIEASGSTLSTAATGDARTLSSLRTLGLAEEARLAEDGASALGRLKAGLFEERPTELSAAEESVSVFSAPGESRECVEIVRRIHREAERGVPFDRIAVILRSPHHYRAHLAEAFRRGGVPAFFARGTTRPDTCGRAFLALLGCASSGLPASRFAEFLSLGEIADPTEDEQPPPPRTSEERWVPPDDGLLSESTVTIEDDVRDDEAHRAPLGMARAPWRWERLIVNAAVIGRLDRWKRRLHGLQAQFEDSLAELDDPDGAEGLLKQRELDGLRSLTAYALPLLADLSALPTEASWGIWIDKLEELATRALKRPDRVLAVLAELRPMSSVGPVRLPEVRLVLERRLLEVSVPPLNRRYGRVFVASTDDTRGLAFDVVFVPGLAEKLFPVRVVEDPVLPDRVRRGSSLPTNHDRAANERLALRLAVGAAGKRVSLSYPRLDVDQARPRTPSFYGLEVLRAAEGALPGFGDLSRRADGGEGGRAVRLGWPAPIDPSTAIDDAEHDLSRLGAVFALPPEESRGKARYLLGHNCHLERALRFREKRWRKTWTDADGLVLLPDEAMSALAPQRFGARSYSATGLQHYAWCPYRFVLQAIHKLAPRKEPAPLEELDALQRGSLIHDALYGVSARLRDEGLLPVRAENRARAHSVLEEVVTAVAAEHKERLAPAIERVWDDGIRTIKADLREWLERECAEVGWLPQNFEFSFGPSQVPHADPNSRAEAVQLDCRIQLRGSINLVERSVSGALRATDYKTGKVSVDADALIKHGEVLQPVLYALALEKLFPGEQVVGGRLYFCTSKGEFSAAIVPLDEEARAAAMTVASAIGDALDRGFLPAAPKKEGCKYCEYLLVCGPNEEHRVKRKPQSELELLDIVRSSR